VSDFIQEQRVRWSDLDPNGHVRHSVYYDWGASCRLGMLETLGVGVAWLAARGIGPVLFREEARFLREIRHGDEIRIDLAIAGLSEDQRKWRIRHRVLRADGDVAALLEVDGAWLDLRARRISPPPAELSAAFTGLPRTEDFAALPRRSVDP
jgi:acyl-CoA thioester hydrolase